MQDSVALGTIAFKTYSASPAESVSATCRVFVPPSFLIIRYGTVKSNKIFHYYFYFCISLFFKIILLSVAWQESRKARPCKGLPCLKEY